MKHYEIHKLYYYVDRIKGSSNATILEKADKCVQGVLYLWNQYELDTRNVSGNIYEHRLIGTDVIVRYEYLFAMDYLSYTVQAYKLTQDESYKKSVFHYLDMYSAFLREKKYIDIEFSIFNEHTIYSQVLLLAKIIDVFGDIPHHEEFEELLCRFAEWLICEDNKLYGDNHGLFQVLGLLHISKMLGDNETTDGWVRKAVEHSNTLYRNLYFDDGTNYENSMMYFDFNNNLFEKVIEFCNFYEINGIEQIKNNINTSRTELEIIAHSDNSLPLIGDGGIKYIGNSIQTSKVFHDLGLTVVKTDDLYLSYKNKTLSTQHAHADVSGLTLRFKNTDIIVDSGQFNYDRYTPINRYVRSAAGHSSFLPIYADAYFLGEFCKSVTYSENYPIDIRKNKICIGGKYVFDDIEAERIIEIQDRKITLLDRWTSKRPAVMRQRFVLPEKFVENSFFSVSQKTLEAKVDGLKIRFEVVYDDLNFFTVCNFGVAAPRYDECETTLALDTYAANSVSGKISVCIYIEEDEYE